jgi:hypothetical protein
MSTITTKTGGLAYARKTTVEDQFSERLFPGGVISCGFCGCNLADDTTNPAGTIYVLYTDKKHLNENRPYEVYCGSCLTSHFPKAVIV